MSTLTRLKVALQSRCPFPDKQFSFTWFVWFYKITPSFSLPMLLRPNLISWLNWKVVIIEMRQLTSDNSNQKPRQTYRLCESWQKLQQNHHRLCCCRSFRLLRGDRHDSGTAHGRHSRSLPEPRLWVCCCVFNRFRTHSRLLFTYSEKLGVRVEDC